MKQVNQILINGQPIKTKTKPKKQEVLFYLSFALIPIIQFIIFYIVVNIQSILFAFQKYHPRNGFTFSGIENFVQIFKDMGQPNSAYGYYFKNSLLLFVFSFIFGSILALMFSNYVYKKRIASGAIRVLLYVPHIVSTVTMVAIYRVFVDNALSEIVESLTGEMFLGLLGVGGKTKFITIMFLSIYMSFGNNVLIYTGSMTGINPSIVESAELDGISNFEEFWYITLPSIFPAIQNFVVAGLALMFTDQMLLYNFDSTSAPVESSTMGYYLYKEVQKAVANNTPGVYPKLSAMGVMLTVVVTAVTFGIKKLMTKFGPSVE